MDMNYYYPQHNEVFKILNDELYLNEDVIRIIYKYVKSFKIKDKMLKELIFKRYIHVVTITDNDGVGLIFGGARTVGIGEECGYGIFIKNIRKNKGFYNSIKNYRDYIGFQIISINDVDAEYATFPELKLMLRSDYDYNIKLELQYNKTLLNNYNYYKL